jgi:hypothetical protein
MRRAPLKVAWDEFAAVEPTQSWPRVYAQVIAIMIVAKHERSCLHENGSVSI